MADQFDFKEADNVAYEGPYAANASIDPNSAAAAAAKQSEVHSSLARERQDGIGVFLNGNRQAKKEEFSAIPEKLPEVPATGYVAGKPFSLTLVRLDGNAYLEKNTGYDFILMRRAAYREAKLQLSIASGFRSNEDQTRISLERALHPKKGPAAKPGFSNHQQGLSADISTGISFPDWKSGTVTTSPVYAWLVANAKRFGFDQRDLGKLPDGRPWEPWHWTHASDRRIYGVTDEGSDLTSVYEEVLNSKDASAYVADGQPDLLRLILKAGADYSTAFWRSTSVNVTHRQVIFNAAAAQSVYQSAEMSRRSSTSVDALRLLVPPGFEGQIPLYDFTTGLWSDEDNDNGLGV